jgi:hypothetical protein
MADRVLQRLSRDVVDAMPPDHLISLREAIRLSQERRPHLIDVRTEIPLLFSRYYFVFLFGRSARTRKRTRRTALMGGAVVLAYALVPFVVLGFAGLYVLKTVAGIDVFTTLHLTSILGL